MAGKVHNYRVGSGATGPSHYVEHDGSATLCGLPGSQVEVDLCDPYNGPVGSMPIGCDNCADTLSVRVYVAMGLPADDAPLRNPYPSVAEQLADYSAYQYDPRDADEAYVGLGEIDGGC